MPSGRRRGRQWRLLHQLAQQSRYVIALVASHRLRIAAKPLGVRKVDAGPERTTVQFVPDPPFDPGRLILHVQRDGRTRFAGPDRVRIDRAAPSLEERIALVRGFLEKLA